TCQSAPAQSVYFFRPVRSGWGRPLPDSARCVVVWATRSAVRTVVGARLLGCVLGLQPARTPASSTSSRGTRSRSFLAVLLPRCARLLGCALGPHLHLRGRPASSTSSWGTRSRSFLAVLLPRCARLLGCAARSAPAPHERFAGSA